MYITLYVHSFHFSLFSGKLTEQNAWRSAKNGQRSGKNGGRSKRRRKRKKGKRSARRGWKREAAAALESEVRVRRTETERGTETGVGSGTGRGRGTTTNAGMATVGRGAAGQVGADAPAAAATRGTGGASGESSWWNCPRDCPLPFAFHYMYFFLERRPNRGPTDVITVKFWAHPHPHSHAWRGPWFLIFCSVDSQSAVRLMHRMFSLYICLLFLAFGFVSILTA